MRAERPRAARYPFAANATLTDLESGPKTSERTNDLSLFGCGLVPGGARSTGTTVRLQMMHKGEVFEALGRIANASTNRLGIAFTKVEERHELVLEKWIAELRKRTS